MFGKHLQGIEVNLQVLGENLDLGPIMILSRIKKSHLQVLAREANTCACSEWTSPCV